MKRLITPNRVILACCWLYTLILIFPDASPPPPRTDASKPVLQELNNTVHNLRQTIILILIIIIIIIIIINPRLVSRQVGWRVAGVQLEKQNHILWSASHSRTEDLLLMRDAQFKISSRIRPWWTKFSWLFTMSPDKQRSSVSNYIMSTFLHFLSVHHSVILSLDTVCIELLIVSLNKQQIYKVS
jgi:hypothetical protein